MKLHFIRFVLPILLTPLAVFGGELFPDSPVYGARLFAEKACSRCHSILGQGGTIGPDLGRIEMGDSRLDVASAILNKAQVMAQKMEEHKIIQPNFSGEEMESIIAFLYYVNYFDTVGDPVKGERLVENRGCVRCHSSSSRLSAPPFTVFPRNISPIYLAKSLWNHGPAMQSMMSSRGIRWPEFEGTEIMDVVAWLKGVARGESLTSYQNPGNPNEGRKVFLDKGCPRCHGGADENTRPNLADRSRGLQKSLTQVVAHMWNHAPQIFARMRSSGMKVPEFNEKEMADVVAYIYFLNYFPSEPDVEAGGRLFVEKHCASCHSLSSRVAGIGPDLTVSEKAASSIDLVAAMWNHSPFMVSIMKEQNIPWPQFRSGELKDLVGYIRSLKK